VRVVLEEHRPEWAKRVVPLVQLALFATLVVMGLGWAGLVPAFARPLVYAASPLTLVLLLANQLLGAASATGAFEVIDGGSGRLLHSKLATGRLPNLPELLRQLPPRGTGQVVAATGGDKQQL
jgi:hypothetical protein